MTIRTWTGREARLLREALRLSQREFAATLGIAIRTVAQWDRVGVGITPRPEFQRMLDVALQRASDDAVRRFETAIQSAKVPATSLGSAGAPVPSRHLFELGDVFPASAHDAVDAVADLWRGDLRDHAELIDSSVEPAVWDETWLRWLVAAPDRPSSRELGAVSVGLSDVEAIKSTADLFAKLDNTFGGNHARRSLIQFLSSDVEQLLRGRYDEVIGQSLHRVVAEATLLAGWMCYDAGHHGLAQRYLVRALRLAHSAADAQLAGSILSAMSHQATFLGHYREAIDMAQAALAGTRAVATPTLTAQFLAMQARALAGLGERRRCQLVLLEAERVFERRRPSDDPQFITYFTEAELAAEIAHCMRDIGRAPDAMANAELSLNDSDSEYVRSDFFATVVLADAQLDHDEPELACQTMLSALALGRQLRSARSVTYIAEFRNRLPRFADTLAVLDLGEQAADYPLWTAAA
jgi:transcriptional regulator with XRE-family HTH domain